MIGPVGLLLAMLMLSTISVIDTNAMKASPVVTITINDNNSAAVSCSPVTMERLLAFTLRDQTGKKMINANAVFDAATAKMHFIPPSSKMEAFEFQLSLEKAVELQHAIQVENCPRPYYGTIDLTAEASANLKKWLKNGGANLSGPSGWMMSSVVVGLAAVAAAMCA